MELVNVNNQTLGVDELRDLSAFLLELNKQVSKRKITLLFRGNRLENIFFQFGIIYDKDKPDYASLLERLFMIGEKGRYFYNNEINATLGRQIRIDDTGEEMCKLIFDNLNDAVKSKNAVYKRFFEKDGNKDFTSYFKTKNNKNKFLQNISSCTLSERRFIRDYYLNLLHQLAAINYKHKSYGVSTSQKYTVAEKFSGDNVAGRIIIHGWKPTVLQKSPALKKSELPKYQGTPYAFQKEVTLMGGILPQFIIGLELLQENIFFPNPFIFQSVATNNIFREGFDIDQTPFENIMKKTNYRKGFLVIGDSLTEI